MSWASEELAGVDLGDVRRNRRLVQIVEDLPIQNSKFKIQKGEVRKGRKNG